MGGFQQTCLYSLPLDWIQKIIKKAGDDGNFLKSHMTALHEVNQNIFKNKILFLGSC